MAQVKPVQKEQGQVEGLVGMIPGVIGSVVGSVYGGPVGGAAGGAIGGQLGQGMSKGSESSASLSSPGTGNTAAVDRRMQSLSEDPLNQLKQGKAALSSMDPDTQASLSPVLDEAIKKAALEKQQRQQGGY